MSLETPAFPAVVNCPLCQQNALYLFDDIVTDGVWLHCNSCAAHGDIITFSAAVWNTSLPDALTRFIDLDIISGNDVNQIAGDYERAYSRQITMESFWLETSEQVWSHSDDVIACQLNDLGVHAEIGAKGLVGVAHPEQVSQLCGAMTRQKPTKLRPHGPSIVFPFYDLPGRMSGILAVQYGENFESSSHFIPITAHHGRRSEAGYFLLQTTMQPPMEIFKSTQFILDDPFWVLNAQCRQLRQGQPLLPLMSSYTGRESTSYGNNWQSFTPATRLFQSNIITPELVSRAAAAKGYVSILPPARTYDYKLANPTMTRLADMRRGAVTWQEGLHKALAGMNEITAQSFARKLTIPHEKMNAFFRRFEPNFSPGFADRVLSSLKSPPGAPTRVHKKWTIIERDTGWWNHLGQQICSVRPVISKIIHTDTGEKIYAGIIYLNDEQFEFSDNARKIEYMGLLAYSAAVLAPKGKLVIFDRLWNKRSHILAVQLHAPEIVNVSEKLGWDESANVFRFGQYEITNAGVVTPTAVLPQKKQRIVFPEPTPVAPPAIHQFLAPSYQNAFVWNVFSAVAANLIAPIVRQDFTATGLVGNNFGVATRIAAGLNCAHVQSAVMQKSYVSRQISETGNRTDWPVLVSSAFDDTLLSTVVPKCHNRPLIARLSPLCAASAPGYGWCVINGEPPAPTTDFSALQYVLPAYIQRALRNRMKLATTGQSIHRAVLLDLHKWLEETYGKTFNYDYAAGQIMTPETAHKALMQEINHAIQAGKLDVLPRPRRKDQPGNYILRQKENCWLNRKAIDRYFYNGKSATPNWLGIVELLANAGVFSGEEVIQGMPGILVNEQWCNQFWTDDFNSTARDIG